MHILEKDIIIITQRKYNNIHMMISFNISRISLIRITIIKYNLVFQQLNIINQKLQNYQKIINKFIPKTVLYI